MDLEKSPILFYQINFFPSKENFETPYGHRSPLVYCAILSPHLSVENPSLVLQFPSKGVTEAKFFFFF